MTASPNNTIIRAPGGVITDASGNTWQIIGGQVVVNGVADPTTADVIVLAYENGKIWQENTHRLWWEKSEPADAWSPTYGTIVSPLVDVASVNSTMVVGSVVAGLVYPGITDANGDRWTITAGGQVAVNGVADPTTARVIALVYENGKVWQENADLRWWSKANAADSWSPMHGTRFSPIPPGAVIPTQTYLYGSVVNYTDTVTPAGYTVFAVDDGDRAVTFNYAGRNVSHGLIRNAEGDLVMNVNGRLVNAGSLVTQGGIGSARTKIDIRAGSTFSNTGMIETLHATFGPVLGTLQVVGSGTFRNSGTVELAGGSSTDFAMTGRIVNSGLLSINDSFGTTHSIVTTSNIYNTGVIENHNVTTIQWGYSGPPTMPCERNSTFTNNGVIKSLYDVSQLTLAAGAFAHSADGSLVHDYHGTLVNNGQILAYGGGDHVEIAAPLRQGRSGHVDIQNGATVKLDSTSDGGTVTITQGMLDFGGDRVTFHGPAGATGFHSEVVLSGASAAFNFERSDISLVFKSTSPTTADLLVNLTQVGAPAQIADIRLAGVYHASQFQLSGSEVLYTKSA